MPILNYLQARFLPRKTGVNSLNPETASLTDSPSDLPALNIAVIWAQYGPYHIARVAALQKRAGASRVHAVELSNLTADYEWMRAAAGISLVTLCPGVPTEHLGFWQVYRQARRSLAELDVDVCLLPSYSPKPSLAALLAAKSLGIGCVMMNESHAGTARARGPLAFVKRRLVGLFDAALVGGRPHKRYFAALGLDPKQIFVGYDAVDNNYFAERAQFIRGRADEFRNKFNLPLNYFLSLGRFVGKKNLPTLIRAYRRFLNTGEHRNTHLVLVGSGEQESQLLALCREMSLPVYDHTREFARPPDSARVVPGVHFYGFRQIEENPVFYALADAFILPSLWEEWGLVVNEAMASGLPVVVSQTAGCAEDLLGSGWPALPDAAASQLHQRLARLTCRIRQNGFTFDPRSDEALAAALITLADIPALRQAMGRASRRIIEGFSCDRFAEGALLAAQAAARQRATGLRKPSRLGCAIEAAARPT